MRPDWKHLLTNHTYLWTIEAGEPGENLERTRREPGENLQTGWTIQTRTLFLWGVTIAGFWFDSFLWTNYFWIPMCILLVIKEGLKWGNKEVMFWFFHVRELEQSISNNMRNVSFLLEELILFNNHLCPWNRSCAFIKLWHSTPAARVRSSFLQVAGIDVGVKKETAPSFEW